MRSFLCLVLVLPVVAFAEEQVTDSLDRTSLDFAVGFRGFARTFGPTDGTRTVGAWTGGGSGVTAEGSWFPAASVTKGFGGNLGLIGDGQTSIGLSTEYEGAQFATRASIVRGGLALRFPVGRHEILIHGGASFQYFGVATTSVDGTGQRPAVYDVGYFGPRAGLGYRLGFGIFSLRLRVAFTYTLSRGELGVAYAGSTAGALDGQLGVGMTVLPNIQLRANVDVTQVFVAIDGSHRAGDTTFGGSLALAVAM